MPWIEDTPTPQPIVPTGQPLPNPFAPSGFDTISAAFRRENPLVNVASRLWEGFYEPEPGHNPLNHIAGTIFEERYADRFIGSRSGAETFAIMGRIQQEMQDDDTLAAAGFGGTVAQIAAGTLDPTLALPGGVLVRGVRGGYSLTRSALSTGAAAALAAGVSESALQLAQETRTAGESMANIGSAAVLGGLIGGGAAAFLTRAERTVLERTIDRARADTAFHSGATREGFDHLAAAGDVAAHGTATPDEQGFIVFHGSPHDFDRFSMERIGSGEGAQAFGHGLYFAENQGVARSYQDMYEPANNIEAVARLYLNRAASAEQAIESLKGRLEMVADDSRQSKEYTDAINLLQSGWRPPEGNLYRARIRANQDHFLDWDLPLSEQTTEVQKAVRPLVEKYKASSKILADLNIDELSGENLLRAVREVTEGTRGPRTTTIDDALRAAPSGPETSRVLSEAGIPGIKYLDQGSRDTGDGTRNFVVFDDSLIEVVDKNGVPVQRPEPAPTAAPAGGATSAGAAAADTRALELERSGLGFTAPISTTRRVLSSDSVEARRVVADGFETPYRFQGGEGPRGPALDRLARMEINGARVEVSDGLERLFSEYRFGDVEQRLPRLKAGFEDLTGRAPDKMTYGEFKAQIARALMEGDTHDIPQVTQAAQLIRRRVFEPWKERAIAAGLLPEGVEVKTAESYFQRVYNKERIRAERPAFVNKVQDWLKSDQITKAAAKERIVAFRGALDVAEEQIAKLTSQIETAQSALERVEIRADEAGAGTRAVLEPSVRRRTNTLADQASGKEAKIADLEDRLAREIANAAAMREKIETEIAAWEGKSVSDAKAAMKARQKAEDDRIARATAKGEPAPTNRLESADAAIDRSVRRIIEDKDTDLTDADLRERAHEITERILGSPDGRLPYDIPMGGPEIGWRGAGGEPARGPLAARQFNIPDAVIRDFLEDDVETVVAMHLRTIVPDVMLTERFGDVRMTEAFKKIEEDYARLTDAATSQKERNRLGKEREAVIRDVAAMRDRMRGVYGWSPDLRNMARVAAGAKSVNNLTSMGVSAISSLPDMAGVVLRYGLTTAFQDGWAPYFKYLVGGNEGWAQFKSQMRAVGIGIETATNARQNALDEVTDVYRPGSRFERGLQAVNDRFFIANLLAPLTDAQKSIAAHVAVSEILRASKAAAEGKASKKQLANLAEAGIDQGMAGRIWGQFQTGGEVTDGVHLPNTADWTDRAAADALNGAVSREVDIAVVTPGQEKPLWMSHPVLSLLGQFKAFTAAATERVLVANLMRRDAHSLVGVLTAAGLGMLSYKLNSFFGGQETSKRPQDWVKEGISRGGLLGWLEEGNALASKMTRGGVDVYRMIGADKPLSRFASRSTLDMFLGPTASKIEGLSKVTGAAAARDWTAADTTALRRLVAFQNLFLLRGMINQAEHGFNGMLGIPPRAEPENRR